MAMKFDYDVIVIGSGAGGTVSARLLAKTNKSVAIVESDKLGGECPNYACVPTKALLESAHLYHKARNAEKLGLRGSGIGFNYPSVRAWKSHAIKQTGVADSEKSLHQAGINVIHGAAHFIDPQTISVGRARFKARQFIIATGSELTAPNIPGLSKEDYLTYKSALELTRPPRSIAIIGGGPVGVEFASIFGSFGSKVYLVERSSHLLSNEDPICGKTVARNLEESYDVQVITSASLEAVSTRGGKKLLSLKAGSHHHEIVVDDLLMATGKSPNIDIGLENAGVAYSSKGIVVNPNLRTSVPHIYAVGDVVGGYQFTHVSLYHGRLAAHNILHGKKQLSLDYSAIPRAVFTAPEVACVGPSEKELKNKGVEFTSATTDINVVSRASVGLPVKGFVKVVAHKKTGRLLSANIVAPSASENIQQLTVAIANDLTAADVANTIHPFPTWSEAIRVACTQLAKA